MRIVSSIPGRTRFKVSPDHHNVQEMEKLASGLEAHSDVHDVQYNVQTGSILVHHDPHHAIFNEVKDVLRDLGCVFSDITGTAELVSIKDESGNNLDFNSAISDLNERVLQATNGMLDLRYVLPLGLGTLAVLQLLTYGWQFNVVPWYILAYFAFDSFLKLNFNEESATQSS